MQCIGKKDGRCSHQCSLSQFSFYFLQRYHTPSPDADLMIHKFDCTLEAHNLDTLHNCHHLTKIKRKYFLISLNFDTSLKQERHRGGVSWFGPTATAFSLVNWIFLTKRKKCRQPENKFPWFYFSCCHNTSSDIFFIDDSVGQAYT